MNTLVRGEIVGRAPVRAAPVSVPTFPRRWYILQCYPSAEGKVTRVLEREGVSFYFPMVQATRRITRRRAGSHSEVRRTVKEPLFAGLLFIPGFAVDQVLVLQDRMSGIDGVAGFMRFGDWTAWLPPKLMDDIRTIERLGNIPPSRRKRLFTQGEEIRVMEGPFRGFNGVVDRLDSKGRLMILVSLFGRLASVGLTESQVEKI